VYFRAGLDTEAGGKILCGGSIPARHSCEKQAPPDPIIVSFTFLAARVVTLRTNLNFFPHRTNGVFVKHSVTHFGYYSSSSRLYDVRKI
jgi:hypothetical protein